MTRFLAPALFALATTTVALPTLAAEDGATVYNQNCAMCHAAGLANAPKLGDKAAWAPRVATGREALLKSALNGKGVMPPRAGNPQLTDAQISAALDHILASVK